MKKISLYTLLFTSWLLCFSLSATICYAKAFLPDENAYIPKDTVLHFILLDPLDSKKNHVNDTIHLRLSEDLTIDGVVLIPKHTVFKGILKKVQKGKLAAQSAVIRIKLENYVLPNQKVLPLDQKDIKIKAGMNYTATASSFIVPFSGLLLKGREIHLSEGAKITYTFETDFDLGMKSNELAASRQQ